MRIRPIAAAIACAMVLTSSTAAPHTARATAQAFRPAAAFRAVEQPRPRDTKESPMTNADVIALVEAGLPDAVVIEKIRQSRTAFDTSTTGLVALRKASVSGAVIQVMINPAATAAPAPAGAGVAVPAGTPEPCAALPGGQLPYLTGASPAMWYARAAGDERVEIQYERGTLHCVGFMGIGATLLLLKPVRGQLRLPGDVVFYSCLNPTDTPLVRFTLDSEDNERHTSVARGGPFNQSFRISDGDLVPVSFTKLPQGFFEIKPKAVLTSGEYGFVPQAGFNYFVAGERVYAFGVD